MKSWLINNCFRFIKGSMCKNDNLFFEENAILLPFANLRSLSKIKVLGVGAVYEVFLLSTIS